jgi:hypothetical protein
LGVYRSGARFLVPVLSYGFPKAQQRMRASRSAHSQLGHHRRLARTADGDR